jgi:tRNA threonylcarbamoyladenosine biosynthesis protein TsaB
VQLTPSLVEMLARQGLEVSALTGIAVSQGPGSFTGLRIGMSLGKGLAYALEVPIVGIPTLDVLAYAQRHQALPICAVVRAGRGRICVGLYRSGAKWGLEGEYILTTVEDLAGHVEGATLFCGELSEGDRELLCQRLGNRAVVVSPAFCLRRAGYLAELGWERIGQGRSDPLETLVPIYLHRREA